MSKRIWNEEELKAMPYVKKQLSGCYVNNSGVFVQIDSEMVGLSIEECYKRGFVVQNWMIATTEEKPRFKGVVTAENFDIKEPERKDIFRVSTEGKMFVHGKEVEFKTQNNMKTVKLNNGTLLEEGKKYRLAMWADNFSVECIKIHNDKCVVMELDELDEIEVAVYPINNGWLPYTAPQEEVKWKTFLMVVQHHKSHIPYQVIIRCKSIEDAKIIHKNAISITEVEIDIKEK